MLPFFELQTKICLKRGTSEQEVYPGCTSAAGLSPVVFSTLSSSTPAPSVSGPIQLSRFPGFLLPLVWMHDHHSNSSGSVSPFTRIPAALEDVQSTFLRTLLNSEGVFRHALLCNSITGTCGFFYGSFLKALRVRKKGKVVKHMRINAHWARSHMFLSNIIFKTCLSRSELCKFGKSGLEGKNFICVLIVE